MLKLAVPCTRVAQEAAALGHPGYAKLYASDLDAGALLLESLGPCMDLPAEAMVTELACDPAYDCGVVLRQTTAAEFPALCRRLATVTDLPAQAIAEWTFVERVSTGLYLLSLGDPERSALFLDAALCSTP